ncbi:MAG: oligosaccharide flippase family protein [Brumimicrobium sp.]|nr:oligosaccharide flippase family protein [Brumimicrobium sp.]
MQKKFLGNLLFIILLNLLIKPIYIFGIDLQIQNIVGAEDYGMYFSLLNFSFLFNMFLDIGITNYNTKNTAQYPHAVSKYMSSFLGVKIVLIFLYTFITIGFALLVGYSDKEMYILSFFIINQIMVGIIQYLRSNFAGLHLFKIDAILSVMDRFLLILFTSLLLYGNILHKPFQIEWFIYLQTLTYFLTLITAIILTGIKIGKLRVHIKKTFSIAILKRSFPFALLILLMMLYTRIDSVMIERMLPNGKEQAGIYAQGFRLLDALNMFAFLVAGLLLPVFSRIIRENKPIQPILQMSSKLLIGTTFVISIGLAIYANLVISKIYHEHIETASTIFFWLVLCFIPLSFSHIFSTLLTANNNLRQLNQMAIAGIIVNVGLNYTLIPIMGAEGAAIATLFTQTTMAIIQVLLVLKVFKFHIHWDSIIRFFILICIVCICAIESKINIDNQFFGLLISIGVGSILLFVLKLFNVKDFLLLIKTKSE